MFNDIERTKKGKTEICLHSAKEVAAFAAHFKPGHWCFLGPASEKTWWNGITNNPQGQWDSVASQMVDIFECRTEPPIFPATAILSLGPLKEGRRNDHSRGTFENKKTLIQTTLAGNVLCIYNCLCRKFGSDTENIRRRTGNRPRPRAVDINYAKTAETPTSSRRLDATTHRESRDADSESVRTGRICQNNGDWTIPYHQ